MTTSPAKFTFDLDMGNSTKNSAIIKNEQLLLAKQKAYKEGFVAGESSEQSRHNQALEAAIQKLINQCNKIASEREQIQKDLLSQSVNLATQTGKKLASHLIEKQPQIELEALIIECLSSLENVPHLVIHCHEDLVQICQKTAEDHMRTSRFSGKLVVMGNEDIALGDGKVEWVDGGLMRDSSDILQQIDVSINNYLNAHDISNQQDKVSEIAPNDKQEIELEEIGK